MFIKIANKEVEVFFKEHDKNTQQVKEIPHQFTSVHRVNVARQLEQREFGAFCEYKESDKVIVGHFQTKV